MAQANQGRKANTFTEIDTLADDSAFFVLQKIGGVRKARQLTKEKFVEQFVDSQNELSELTDVDLVNLQQGALLGYNGSKWRNLPIGTANQLLGVNAAGDAQEYKTLSGTANQVVVTNGVGGITLSLPQSIATSSTPTFAGMTLNSQNLYDTPHEIYAIGDSLTGSGIYISRLESNLGADWNVNNEGIGGNTTTAMLARFQADVLDQNNPEYVIVWGGVNDAVHSILPSVIQNNLQQMYTLAKNQGLKVIALTIAPFKNSVGASSQDLANAALVNNWIINNAIDVDYIVDVYSLLNNPLDEGALLAIYNSGDNIHLSTAGYNAVADLIFSQVNFTPLLQTNFTNNGNSLLNGDLDISGVLRLSNKLGLQYGGIGDVGTPANGQILIGNGLNFTLNTLSGTTNQVTVTNGAGTITLSLPQSIATTSSPTFANGTFTGTLAVTGAATFDSTVTTAGNLRPSTTATYDLGVTGTRWRDLFISRNVEIGNQLQVYESNLTTAHRLAIYADAFGSVLNSTKASGSASILRFQVDNVEVGRFNSSAFEVKVAAEISGNLSVEGQASALGTIKTFNRRVDIGSTTNNGIVGLQMGIFDGVNNRKAGMFLDDNLGIYGFDTTASSGIPDFVIQRAGSTLFTLSNTTASFVPNVTISGTLGVTGALSLGTGNAVTASVATPSTHKVAIVINGTTYYLLASNV